MVKVTVYFKLCLALIPLFIVLLTFVYRRAPVPYRFEAVVVFGDSFSDTGNAYRLTDHAPIKILKSYKNRYCDGPIWVDRLKVPEKYSYAFGGAITDNDMYQARPPNKPGVRQQIVLYLNEARQNKFDVTSPLYMIWIGFNNFATDRSVDPKLVVQSLINSIQDLVAVGAKNFFIFNEAPFQGFPIYQEMNKTEFYIQLTDSFNEELKDKLILLQKSQPRLSINMFDNHALITKILSEASSTAATFPNTIQDCLTHYSIELAENFCTNRKQYVFYDKVHFSSSVHQSIANAIQPFLFLNFQTPSSDSYIYSF